MIVGMSLNGLIWKITWCVDLARCPHQERHKQPAFYTRWWSRTWTSMGRAPPTAAPWRESVEVGGRRWTPGWVMTPVRKSWSLAVSMILQIQQAPDFPQMLSVSAEVTQGILWSLRFCKSFKDPFQQYQKEIYFKNQCVLPLTRKRETIATGQVGWERTGTWYMYKK